MATYVFPLRDWNGAVSPHWGDPTAIGGSDLFAPLGTVIQSIADGVVTFAGWDSLGGNAVQIHGSDGLDYYYAHMSALPSVVTGQAVSAGTQLGLVGNTGDAASGPTHLHIGIGHGIQTGGGPMGGLGIGFDAVSFLRGLLASPMPDKPPANVVPPGKQNPSFIPNPFTNPPSLPSIGVNIPPITLPSVPDVPGAITGAGQGVVNAIQQAIAPFASGIGNLNQWLQFAGSGKTIYAAVLLFLGFWLTLAGIVLFALSLIDPASVGRLLGGVARGAAG